MNKLLLTIFTAIVCSAFANGQSNSFVGKYSGVTLTDVEPVAGGYILLGKASGKSHWARTDTAGVVLSGKSYPVTFSDARFLPDKGFITIFQNTDSTFSVMKLDSNGNEVWINLYKLPIGQVIKNNLNISIDKYPAGYWITGGMYKSTNHGFMIQADTLGNILQSNMVSSADTNILGDFYGGIGTVLQGSDRSYYFSINAEFFEEGTNMGMVKTDSALNIKWCKDMAVDLPTSNGIVMIGNKIIVASAAYNYTYNYSYAAVIEVDTAGTLIKSGALNAEFSQFNALCSTKDSGIIVASSTRVPGRLGAVSFALKLNSLWQADWTMVYPENESEFGDNIYCVRQTNPGYIMGGTWLIKTDKLGRTTCDDSALALTLGLSYGINKKGVYFYPLTITKSAGSITATNISDTISYVCGPLAVYEPVQSKEIIELFPNPNNGQFTIESSGASGKSIVEVYNMLGEKVYSQTCNINPPGRTTFNINLSAQSNGLYLYRVLTEESKLAGEGKFIVQK